MALLCSYDVRLNIAIRAEKVVFTHDTLSLGNFLVALKAVLLLVVVVLAESAGLPPLLTLSVLRHCSERIEDLLLGKMHLLQRAIGLGLATRAVELLTGLVSAPVLL